MGFDLAEKFPAVRRTFAEADEALGESLTETIRSGPEDLLKQTANAQPAILTVSVAIGRVLLETGIRPVVMAGHSLGEYSALVLSGSVSFPDAVRLVRLRGRLMQEAVPIGRGTMAAILGMEDTIVEEVCRRITASGDLVEAANFNCPGQLVISGTVRGVELALEGLKAQGCRKAIPLSVSAPFHCSLLEPAGKGLETGLGKVSFSDPQIPYVANVDAEVVREKGKIVSRLVEQVSRPVRWTQSLFRIRSEFSPDLVIEVGPGKVVSGHWKKIAPETPCLTTESVEALSKILSS
jgi:[acyl-carrier-protein] S-malonyltransferase